MIRFIKKCFLLFLVVSVFPVMAQAAQNDLVQELIVKSGISAQIEMFPLQIKEGLKQQYSMQQIPKDIYEKLEKTLISAVDTKKIERSVYKQFDTRLSDIEISSILSWLESSLGKKITLFEIEASTPEAQNQMANELQKLLSDPNVPDRIRLLQRMEKSLDAKNKAVDMVINIQVAMITAVSASTPQSQLSFNDILEMVNTMRPQIEAVVSQQLINYFLYTYRSISDVELERYMRFVESKVGVKYHKVADEALTDAIIESAKNIGRNIGEMVNKEGKPAPI